MLTVGHAWAGVEGTGMVCGVFSRASYLRISGHLLALCRCDVPSGPLHLRVTDFPSLAVGQPVALEAGRLHTGRCRFTIADTCWWTPPPVFGPGLIRAAEDRGLLVDGPGPGSGLDPAVVMAARRALTQGGVGAAAAVLGGRGSGLTPAGDDVVAGILVVHALLEPTGVAERLRVVASVRTNEVAGSFLHWAAQGQTIEPVHELLVALATGQPARERAARAALLATGASSGAALLWGLALGLRRAVEETADAATRCTET